MVNPDVDAHTKTLHHHKILRKTQKKKQPIETQKNAKTEYKLSEDCGSQFPEA